MSPGWSDTPKSHPCPAPNQAEAVARLFLGQALVRAPLSLLTHTHICEPINITLTRSVFADRSESTWHFLNSGWHCEAGSRSWLWSGVGGGKGGPQDEDAGLHMASAPWLGEVPEAGGGGGWLSRFLKDGEGASRGARVVVLHTSPAHRTAPPPTACTWHSCYHPGDSAVITSSLAVSDSG